MKNLTLITLILFSSLSLAQNKSKLYEEVFNEEEHFSMPSAKIILDWDKDVKDKHKNSESFDWYTIVNHMNDTATINMIGNEYTFTDDGKKISFTSDVGDIKFYYKESQKKFIRMTWIEGGVFRSSLRTYGVRYNLSDGREITITDNRVVRADMPEWKGLRMITIRKGKNVTVYSIHSDVQDDRSEWDGIVY
jgi:hypothetical protein